MKNRLRLLTYLESTTTPTWMLVKLGRRDCAVTGPRTTAPNNSNGTPIRIINLQEGVINTSVADPANYASTVRRNNVP